MPVPSSLNDLSTTPSLNSPAGSESPALVDDYLRTHASFIKQVNDASVKTTGDQTVAGVKTFTGNVVLGGTGQRITGDFSNATVANRVMFQTSTVNGETNVGVVPNGSSQFSRFTAFGASDPVNASLTQIYTDQLNGFSVLRAGANGSGSNLPLSLNVGGSEKMRIDTSGNVTVSSAGGGLGYGTGAGGTVTQATSKSTAVTLNKPTGQITTAADSLAANTTTSFSFSNSLLGATDTLVLNQVGNATASAYNIWVGSIGAGSATINIRNITAGALAEGIKINFAIIKGATS